MKISIPSVNTVIESDMIHQWVHENLNGIVGNCLIDVSHETLFERYKINFRRSNSTNFIKISSPVQAVQSVGKLECNKK